MKISFGDVWSNERFDLVAGLFIGAMSFWLAEILVPHTFRTISEHDHLLSVRVGLLYTPLVACWFSKTQSSSLKSLGRQLLVGLILGVAYAWLCFASTSFTEIMILFPSMFAAALNVLTQASDSPGAFSTRLLRVCSDGLIAGFALGLTYSLLLSLGAVCLWYVGFISCQDPSLIKYVQAMAFGGPCAFGLASCLFFLLIRRSHNESAKL